MTDKIEKLTEYYKGDDLAARVLSDKYLLREEKTPEQMWIRLSGEVASQEREEDAAFWANNFSELLNDFKFIPGGRIMYALGRDENVSCTNCYVIPIKEDSIEGIYEWLKESALTYRATGGVGTDISILRPKGSKVKNSGGESPGACSFMDLMSRSTHTVHQKLRRGALMITINVHHPDVLEFINIKKILGKIDFIEGEGDTFNNLYKMVEHANISVQLTDEFLQALESGDKYEQRWPIDAEKPSIKKKISAKKVWDAIIKNAHEHAEPGIFFLDNHKRNDALDYVNPALTPNPCGEQFLGPYGNCLLGHMNLDRYVVDPKGNVDKPIFNYSSFSKDIKVAVRFLDNCIDWNDGKHALPEQNETALNERRIGLGITGLADCLIRLGIKYDSEEALEMVEKIMKCYRDSAYEASVEIAKEKGAFPWFNKDEWLKSDFTNTWFSNLQTGTIAGGHILKNFNETGIRNSFLLTMAPVGSGSIVGQVSSGIEPIFATSYTRRVRDQDGETFNEYKTFPKIVNELFGDDNNLPDHVRTAHDIDPSFRVRLQAVIQKYVDNSISSTVNLSEDTPAETVGQIYLDAWKQGLKSITVYREGSREGVLITDKKEDKKEDLSESFKKKRPVTIWGRTYKIPSGADEKLYITVNPFPLDPKRPFEVLISSFSGTNPEIQTITVLLSALLKTVEDPTFIIDHLRRIESPEAPIFWRDKEAGKRHQINSVPRAVAIALEKFIEETKDKTFEEFVEPLGLLDDEKKEYDKCPSCRQSSLISENGCTHCIECGYEKCG